MSLSSGAGLRLFNRTTTAASKSATTVDFERHADSPTLDVLGSIAIDAEPLTRDVAVVNPTVFFAQSLKEALVARGIEVTGEAIDADDVLDAPAPGNRRVLAQWQSPPLSEIAAVLMKVSQNLYAETLLKAIGASKGGLGTIEGGRLATRALMASWGIPESTYVQMDGSGLSRYDYVTADMLVTILDRLYHSPHDRDAFIATLPIAGKDGTVSSRMKKTRAEGNATTKTGSIANVRCLSGYVHTRDGEVLAFSILANNFAVPASTVTWIADLAVETLANFHEEVVALLRRGRLLLALGDLNQGASRLALDGFIRIRRSDLERGNRGFRLFSVRSKSNGRRLSHGGFPIMERLHQTRNFRLRIVANDPEVGGGHLTNARLGIRQRGEQRRNHDLRVERRPLAQFPQRSHRFPPDDRLIGRQPVPERPDRGGAHEAQSQRGFGCELRLQQQARDIRHEVNGANAENGRCLERGTPTRRIGRTILKSALNQRQRRCTALLQLGGGRFNVLRTAAEQVVKPTVLVSDYRNAADNG